MQYQDQDRTAPYSRQQTGRVFLHQFKHGSGRLTIFALIAGLLGLAVGVVSLVLLHSYRDTATTQIRQLQQAVSNAQAASQSNASSLSGLSGKVSTIGAGMAALAPYSMVCSQDLTGANGPAEFFFLCSSSKP